MSKMVVNVLKGEKFDGKIADDITAHIYNTNVECTANLERSTPLVELMMGGIAYLLDYSLSFRAGYVHTINVTLNTSPDQEQIEIAIDPSVDTW